MGQYRARDAGERPLVHLPTGIARLDEVGLLELGILTSVVAHPGDGKSAFALQLLEGCARAGWRAQGYFIEDPRDRVADRVFSGSMGVGAHQLRRLKVQEEAAAVEARIRAAQREAAWARRVIVDEDHHESGEILELIQDRWTEDTRLVVVDYAQAFDVESDEKSIERVIARLAWNLNQLAKRNRAAAVLLCQPRTQLVEQGRRWFENHRWKARGRDGEDPEPSPDWVEGFRPQASDVQWSPGAVRQRSRAIGSLFRPGSWMRAMGVEWPDDTLEWKQCKGNYGPSQEVVQLGWDGPTTRILDRPRKARK